MKRKRTKIKWRNIIVFMILILSLAILILSVIQIIEWKKHSDVTEQQVKKVQEVVSIKELVDSPTTEIIEQVNIKETSPYWKYIKMNLIDVDFKELLAINNETKGWIQVKGTNINYPFVQTNNNDYYLTHTFNKTKNNAGWVFLDYRNNLASNNRNTILYAHGRLDKTMFGSLKNILSSGWYDNSDNHVIKLSTEYENTLWQVFSVYSIPTTSDYLKVDFNSSEEFVAFADMLKVRSAFEFDTTISENDYILTLSTCLNDKEKVVLHAKLIKKEVR